MATTGKEQALENLRMVLTGARPRAKSTIVDYLSKARKFLNWLPHDPPPDDMDLHRYFAEQRHNGIGEGTLTSTYTVLKKLYSANRWPWPLGREDRPEPPKEPQTPAFRPEQVEELILNCGEYSDAERFYLALSTTYGMRREELARVKRKDIREGKILVRTAKKGPQRWHLIPAEIMPAVRGYRVKEHQVRAMSAMFQRICRKGLGQRMPGYGWHSIRRTLLTLLPMELAKKGMDPSLAAHYLRWSRRTIGVAFFGTAMAGVYARPEILDWDEHGIDRLIFEVHPFLKVWRRVWPESGDEKLAPESKSEGFSGRGNI